MCTLNVCCSASIVFIFVVLCTILVENREARINNFIQKEELIRNFKREANDAKIQAKRRRFHDIFIMFKSCIFFFVKKYRLGRSFGGV